MGLFYFIIKYIISIIIRKRFIIEIIKDANHYSLINYNQSKIAADESQIDVESGFNDFFLNQLFGNTAIIHLKREKCEKLALFIKNKKYYLVPSLFESEISFLKPS
jgi:hypothetical protein